MMRTSEYRMRRRVRFHEVDGAGIVHFSWFYRYMEEAEIELWRSAGLGHALRAGLGFPRVAASFEFKRPLRFDDEFEALIQITSIRERSITYVSVLTLAGETIARGTMTVVCVRPTPGEPMKAIPFPAEMIERVEAVAAQI